MTESETLRQRESIEAQPTKDQNLKIPRCFKLQDLASTFWDMTFGHICWFASLIAAWSLTAVAWAWWTTKRHTTGKFHKLSLKIFWVFRARTLPEPKMLQCLAWSNDLAIIQYKVTRYINVHQRTTQCHTVSHSVTGELKNSKTVLQCGGPWIDQDPEASSKWIVWNGIDHHHQNLDQKKKRQVGAGPSGPGALGAPGLPLWPPGAPQKNTLCKILPFFLLTNQKKM